MEKPVSLLLSGGTVEPENPYSCILKVTGQVWENQKMISIDANQHTFQPVSFKIWDNGPPGSVTKVWKIRLPDCWKMHFQLLNQYQK